MTSKQISLYFIVSYFPRLPWPMGGDKDEQVSKTSHSQKIHLDTTASSSPEVA